MQEIMNKFEIAYFKRKKRKCKPERSKIDGIYYKNERLNKIFSAYLQGYMAGLDSLKEGT